jgi:hypothetical protein
MAAAIVAVSRDGPVRHTHKTGIEATVFLPRVQPVTGSTFANDPAFGKFLDEWMQPRGDVLQADFPVAVPQGLKAVPVQEHHMMIGSKQCEGELLPSPQGVILVQNIVDALPPF